VRLLTGSFRNYTSFFLLPFLTERLFRLPFTASPGPFPPSILTSLSSLTSLNLSPIYSFPPKRFFIAQSQLSPLLPLNSPIFWFSFSNLVSPYMIIVSHRLPAYACARPTTLLFPRAPVRFFPLFFRLSVGSDSFRADVSTLGQSVASLGPGSPSPFFPPPVCLMYLFPYSHSFSSKLRLAVLFSCFEIPHVVFPALSFPNIGFHPIRWYLVPVFDSFFFGLIALPDHLFEAVIFSRRSLFFSSFLFSKPVSMCCEWPSSLLEVSFESFLPFAFLGGLLYLFYASPLRFSSVFSIALSGSPHLR